MQQVSAKQQQLAKINELRLKTLDKIVHQFKNQKHVNIGKDDMDILQDELLRNVDSRTPPSRQNLSMNATKNNSKNASSQL